MTYIEVLKAENDACDFCKDSKYANCENCGYELRVEAIKKQIPKKPIKNESTGVFYCPSCSYNDGTIFSPVGFTQDGKTLIYPKTYCQDCGQKIDWSEVEE